jgi:hypothetical protein
VDAVIEDKVAQDGCLGLLDGMVNDGRLWERVLAGDARPMFEAADGCQEAEQVVRRMVFESGADIEALGCAVNDTPRTDEPGHNTVLEIEPKETHVLAGGAEREDEEGADRVEREGRALDLEVGEDGFEVCLQPDRRHARVGRYGEGCVARSATDGREGHAADGERPGLLPCILEVG